MSGCSSAVDNARMNPSAKGFLLCNPNSSDTVRNMHSTVCAFVGINEAAQGTVEDIYLKVKVGSDTWNLARNCMRIAISATGHTSPSLLRWCTWLLCESTECGFSVSFPGSGSGSGSKSNPLPLSFPSITSSYLKLA